MVWGVEINQYNRIGTLSYWLHWLDLDSQNDGGRVYRFVRWWRSPWLKPLLNVDNWSTIHWRCSIKARPEFPLLNSPVFAERALRSLMTLRDQENQSIKPDDSLDRLRIHLYRVRILLGVQKCLLGLIYKSDCLRGRQLKNNYSCIFTTWYDIYYIWSKGFFDI